MAQPGFLPPVAPKAAPSKLYLGATGADGDAAPRSIGSSGIPYTTSRVFPDAAVTAAPYRLAGKLFFRDPGTGSTYVCSASIIQRRLLLTAGHCVYNAAARRFYTDFNFIPAYNATLATQPFGQWSWNWAIVTGEWAGGGGGVPNTGDFAIIEARDQYIAGATRKAGEYLGWFGWATYALSGQHVTALGYPANLDGGGRMIATSSQANAAYGCCAHIGSFMRGGSSGGPWIRDFGILASGQTTPGSSPNQIVGVTSYGPVAIGPYFQGSTILNNAFVGIRNTACARAGNC
jgi:V8-like Glu-specific endopeptidase